YERIVRRLQVLRSHCNVYVLVGAHRDRHVARAVASVPAVLVEAGDAHLPELAVLSEWTERGAAIDALVLVNLGAPVALTVVDAEVHVGSVGGVLDARAQVGRARQQPETLREHWSKHAVTVQRLLVGQPGH